MLFRSKGLYVFSKNASLMSEPNVKSKVVTKLKKGAYLESIEQKGMWYKVKSKKHTGWIVKYLVSSKHPNKKKSVVEMKKINLKKDARKRASSFSTAASARGLADENVNTKDIKSNMEAVKKMEDRKVTDEEVKSFIKEGKLDKE